MRKIDFDKPFSDEDVVWLRQAGFMSEEQIAAHQDRHGAEVPEPEVAEDTVTQSALDPEARMRGKFVGAESGPVNVTPDSPQAGDAIEAEDEGDDYDSWKVGELREEAIARNKLAETEEDVTPVEITGTGKDGAVTKADVIKALRIWDDENPGVLDRVNSDG